MFLLNRSIQKLRDFCSRPLVSLLAVILSGCCLGLLSLYFSAGEHSLFLFLYYLTQPMVVVLNLLPFVLLGLLFYGLTGRCWLAFSLDALICMFFSWAQYWKLTARNDPIIAEDLTILSEAMQMSGQYIQITWQIILSAILVLVAGLLLAWLCRNKAHISLRLGLPALVVAACLLLYPNVYTSGKIYNSMKVWPQINQWFETNKYISRGGIYPFIYSIQSAVVTPPEGYSVETAQNYLTEYENDDIPEDKKVSVIVVMYEAFSDLSQYIEISGKDPYESFHALQSESYHGTLVTNIFAGGTIDSERCVLTGFSQLTNFRRPSWSYARYFADQGYTVNGGHAGYEAFYNRINVNENLGIPGYRFIENYYQDLFGSDQPPTDTQILPEIAEYCLNQMAEGPVFSFNVTYQNHGPYNTTTALFAQDYVPQGTLSDSDYYIINNYLNGVADTGNNMLAMAETFRNSDEPVILVFFGDHKPWLGDQSVTYQALGIDIFSETDDSFYTYYETEYMIWGNQAARDVLGTDLTGTGPTVSPCFLMNVLFDQCGWEGSSYTKLTDEVMAAMPIVHSTGRYQVDGTMVDRQDLSLDNADLLSKMEISQFYLAQDASGQLP